MNYKEFDKKNPELAKYAVITRDGEVSHLVSPQLVKRQNLGKEEIGKLVKLHAERIDLFELMKVMDPEEDKEALYECHLEWMEGEFKMQEVWGFGRDAKFHKFWDLPHCSCPVMDNNDWYPSGRYVTSGACYHGIGILRHHAEQKKITAASKFDEFCEKEEFNDFVEEQIPVQKYKPSVGYRLKGIGECLVLGSIVAASFFAFYCLIINQDFAKELAKYILGGF